MEFSKQEYWSGLPFPPPEDLPNLGSNPCLPHWQVDSLPLSHQGSQESENQTLGFITAEVALEKVDLECDYRGAFCIPPSPVLNPQVDTTESAE